jgi:hypothetical protein
MKSTVALLSVGLALTALEARAQVAPRGEAKVTLAGKSIAIEYGRPALKGRDMLGQLPPEQPWRLGADSDTTLKTAADLSFGSVVVPKGDYVLSVKRSAEGKWRLIATGEKVVEVPLTETKLPASVEVFTIELTGKGNSGQFVAKWQTAQLSAPFTAK